MYKHYKQFPPKVCALLKNYSIQIQENVFQVLGIPVTVAKSGREREAKWQQYTHPRQLQLVSSANIPLVWQWQSGKGAAKATRS